MFLTKEMQVVVLLGGLGTRLNKLEPNIPKAMVDIYGKPFFYYQLQLMKWRGFRNFIFCIGHKGDTIKAYFRNGHRFGVSIRYSYDGEKLLGTAGALRKAFPFLKKDFIVIYGDSYIDVDYSELVYTYYKIKTKENKKGLLAIFKNENRYDKSNIVFKNNGLLKYDKKNISLDMKYIDYGISILDKSIIEKIPKAKYVDLASVYHNLVDKGLMAGFEVKNRFYEIGRPSSLNEFKKFIQHRMSFKKPAIFLDRDGTLNEISFNEDTEQLDSPLELEQLKLLPKAISALRILKSLGYILIVITNQPAAAKGKTTLDKLYEINNKFRDILAKDKIYLDDIFICPHHPTGSPYSKESFLIKNCNCRKPKTGFLNTAIRKFNIDKNSSYIVGDSYTDILTGRSANIKSVFLGQYKCDACQFLKDHKPDLVFDNLYNFACYLKNSGRER